MLRIDVPGKELFDERTSTFAYVKSCSLQLEHSLVSVAKWESKWKRPFIKDGPSTQEELLDYFKCMTITQNVDPLVYYAFTESIIKQITDYIEDPMTATTISENGGKKNREVVTSEIVYYWMTALNIPHEYEKWHFNRLMTLIRVASIKNSPKKKMSKNELYAAQKSINARNKAKYNSKG